MRRHSVPLFLVYAVYLTYPAGMHLRGLYWPIFICTATDVLCILQLQNNKNLGYDNLSLIVLARGLTVLNFTADLSHLQDTANCWWPMAVTMKGSLWMAKFAATGFAFGWTPVTSTPVSSTTARCTGGELWNTKMAPCTMAIGAVMFDKVVLFTFSCLWVKKCALKFDAVKCLKANRQSKKWISFLLSNVLLKKISWLWPS